MILNLNSVSPSPRGDGSGEEGGPSSTLCLSLSWPPFYPEAVVALPGRWTEQNGVFRKEGAHTDMWPSQCHRRTMAFTKTWVQTPWPMTPEILRHPQPFFHLSVYHPHPHNSPFCDLLFLLLLGKVLKTQVRPFQEDGLLS